ncbi:hypothetical protein WOLCODRAFT_143042 [Wolfiporia cocos MD-104 SS10]|uniref:Uncharacterized protein n=1 Tax=Wolfiporia cocos (strain MD-104) TaxID=742152 RepID=A0A2H3JFK9_WOLCO|nr:hypothetical protein WOLCODRAFT_143042 [Wolfiporia cocos MD-104 SS10]
MASVIARAARACRPRLSPVSPRAIAVSRALHQTPFALKSKKGAAKYEDDLFVSDESNAAEDDLFGADSEPTSDAASATQAGPSTSSNAASRRLSPEARLARFNELRVYVSERIGRSPKVKHPQVRNTSWQHLFMLAVTKEQLEEVSEMFPLWRDYGRQFDPIAAKVFIRRCEQLRCPQLALKVFGDHPKYGFDLFSIRAARQLLHSLHVEHSIQDTMLVTGLLGVYKLPPVSSDLVSCAMLTSACYKHGTSQSLTIARAMLPHLQTLLNSVDPKSMQLPTERTERAKLENKEKAWLAWSLTKIEKILRGEGAEFSWLEQWRKNSGQPSIAS